MPRRKTLPPSPAADLLTLAEAAAVLRVCERTVRRLTDDGVLAYLPGGDRRKGRLVPRRSVDKYIASQTIDGVC